MKTRHQVWDHRAAHAFAAQWEGVERDYPLVAARYLEMVNLLMDAWLDHERFFREALTTAQACGNPDSPIKATKEFCEALYGRRIDNGPPEPCDSPDEGKAPGGFGDELDEYIDCLKGRIRGR